MSVLGNPSLEKVLDDLHARSVSQIPDINRYVAQARRRPSPTKEEDFRVYRSDKLLALDRDKAEFCYQTCRSINAKCIVEIGTSFGVSTLYLASAIQHNGGGMVHTSELEPNKVKEAKALFEKAGLAEYIQTYEGDFRTMPKISEPVDFMLIDGWVGTAKPALEMISPWLRPGAVVICDDVAAYSGRFDDYLAFLSEHGFRTMTMPFQDGMEFSIKDL